MGDHHRSTLSDDDKPRADALNRIVWQRQICEVASNSEVNEFFQERHVITSSVNFEVAEAGEGWRNAAYDSTGLTLRIAVVEHIAHHLVASRNQAQRSGGRDAQVVHGFTAQEFADG